MKVPGQPIIEFENVSITLGGRKILDGETFTVERGELFVIIGYSGTGKSVTLQNLTGLLVPDEGSIKVAGEQIVGMDEDELRQMRRRFGYLFQHGALIKWLTVAENVELPLREHTSYSRKRRRAIVQDKLDLVSMGEDGDKYPSEISGGMQKRAALARAIALDPEIVLFDEPTSGLDPVIGHQIDDLIARINRELGITCMVVTHDMKSAYSIADRIAFFYKGGMHFVGTPREVRIAPDPALRHFVSGGRDGQLSMRTSAAVFKSQPVTDESGRRQAVPDTGYNPDGTPDLNSPEYLLKQLPKPPKRQQTGSRVPGEASRVLSDGLLEGESLVLDEDELAALDDHLAEKVWRDEDLDHADDDAAQDDAVGTGNTSAEASPATAEAEANADPEASNETPTAKGSQTNQTAPAPASETQRSGT